MLNITLIITNRVNLAITLRHTILLLDSFDLYSIIFGPYMTHALGLGY